MKISTGIITWEISEDWLVDHSILRKLEDKKLLREEYEEMMGIDPPTEEQRAKTIPIWTCKESGFARKEGR